MKVLYKKVNITHPLGANGFLDNIIRIKHSTMYGKGMCNTGSLKLPPL